MSRRRQPDGPLHGVVVACRRADGRWLLIRRGRLLAAAPGRVCFPGGAVERGESQAAAVAREMQEELGAAVEPLRCVWHHASSRPPLVLWAWLGRLRSTALRPDPAEVAELLWLTTEEAACHPDALPRQRELMAALAAAVAAEPEPPLRRARRTQTARPLRVAAQRIQHALVMGTSSRTRSITLPRGFRAAGATCGIKHSGAPDLALIAADHPCSAAAVFTGNRLAGEPIKVARRHLSRGLARAIVCNSGNANVATGAQGRADALAMSRQVAAHLGCPIWQVIPSSTGVIGRPLPMAKVARGIAAALAALARGPGADARAAGAILTTDLVPKAARRRIRLGGRSVTIAGIAKGSGMIAPNLATMLVFITTDAAIAAGPLRAALCGAVGSSFNRISVDQHTSPSDTVVVLASGAAGHPPLRQGTAPWRTFAGALGSLCADLAYQIVKDGEGATRVIRVRVSGARSGADAARVGRAVVDSPLVKCAVHGADPNWGRIVTAAGCSGAALDPRRLDLSVGPADEVCVFRHGAPADLDGRAAARLRRLMGRPEVVFHLDLRLGRAATEWLGCDLSRRYVDINADYTT